MIIGHNKILEHWIEDDHIVYFTICTQCNKKWKMKELSEKPQAIIKTHTIKIRAHGKIIQTLIEPEIAITQKTHKKQLVNIYLI